jgi:uncharacterized protein (TIGR02145 family)
VYHNEDAKSFRNNTGWEGGDTWSGNGTNKYNFIALPSGWRTASKSNLDIFPEGFCGSSNYAYWWSSSVSEIETAWRFGVAGNYNDFFRAKGDFSTGYAVRCVKD